MVVHELAPILLFVVEVLVVVAQSPAAAQVEAQEEKFWFALTEIYPHVNPILLLGRASKSPAISLFALVKYEISFIFVVAQPDPAPVHFHISRCEVCPAPQAAVVQVVTEKKRFPFDKRTVGAPVDDGVPKVWVMVSSAKS